MFDIEVKWGEKLHNEFKKSYFSGLLEFIENEYNTKIIYPKIEDLFSAFNYCSYDNLKVVILGQDPYHGEGQANGLCFSVNKNVKPPPSLQNIFKELKSDIGLAISSSGDLTNWAKQGILMLNSVLTVEANKAGSHRDKGWEFFTDAVIKYISDNKQNIVFILWGNYAKEKRKLIDINKHLILEAAHPSPFSAYSGFFGCKHFSKTNEFLLQNNILPISWSV